MIKIKVNNIEISVESGTTILNAAAAAGIEIPAMCLNNDAGHFASCMVCLVKEKGKTALIPSCSSLVRDGMDIITEDEEIEEARKTAIELLLSEHIGDCEAPCRISCPAYMNIPLMNTYIAKGDIDKALETVMDDIVFPSVLGVICPAPCEGACHRKGVDSAVSICALKRFAGDKGNRKVVSINSRSKKVAVIGGGIAGMTAAYYLQIKGVNCTVYDKNKLPGGAIRYEIDENILNKEVLLKESDFILNSGVLFKGETFVDNIQFDKMIEQYDAVIVATGELEKYQTKFPVENNGKQVAVNKQTFQTSIDKVFAAGNSIRGGKLAIRSAAQGKECAVSVLQYLDNSKITGEIKEFNSRIGRLRESEHLVYMNEISQNPRVIDDKQGRGYSEEEARIEAERCMHCECLKPKGCKLRDLSGKYDAKQRRFNYEERKNIKKIAEHKEITYEPGKCIKCGICVRMTAKDLDQEGLSFWGRGYDVEITVPFEESIIEAIKINASLIAQACPTGALSKKLN